MLVLSFRHRKIKVKGFYDFNVRTEHKRVEKLRYMHPNPERRGQFKSTIVT